MDRTADTCAALYGRRRPGYRSPLETERLPEPRLGASRRPELVRGGRFARVRGDARRQAKASQALRATCGAAGLERERFCAAIRSEDRLRADWRLVSWRPARLPSGRSGNGASGGIASARLLPLLVQWRRR